jgi:hypothetical protein
MSALGTRIRVSAKRGGAAAEDRVQHFQVKPGEPLRAAIEEGFSGCADHIGHLDGRPRHLLLSVVAIAIARQRQRVERARGGIQVLLREMEINGGFSQIAVS